MLNDSANVVRLEPDVKRHVRVRLARLPSQVHELHRAGNLALAALLSRLFDAADDAFFDLADKAKTNAEQNTFFDAMREVRVQRKSIERRLLDIIDESFARLVGEDDRDQRMSSGELSADALALVDNQDLEQMVALEATISRATAKQRSYTQPLLQALGSLLNTKVTQEQFPFGPLCLCYGAMSQFRRLDVDIKAKLTLFRLFEQVVVNNLAEVNQTLSSCLQDLGVVVEAVTESSVTGRESGASDSSIVISAASSQRELLTLLSFVQKLPASSVGSHGLDVKRVLSAVQHRRGVELRLSRVEQEIIHLVEMLFRFILQGNEMAGPMQELICRLKVPVLKVALLDTQFLEDKKHPARLLLNQLATAAAQWQDGAMDELSQSLNQSLRASVDRILACFDCNIELFGQVLEDFTSIMEKQRRAAEIQEKRTVDAEDGKARSAQARQWVAAEIAAIMAGKSVPSLVAELINGPWSNVLFVAALKHGAGSAEWNDQLAVLVDLVDSVQPYTSKAQRKKLIALIPNLLERMRAGLDAISYNPFEVEELFSSLEEIHLKRIRGEMDTDESTDRLAVPVLTEPVSLALVGSSSSDHLVQIPEEEVLPADDPHLNAVLGFVTGAWFDLTDTSGQLCRCRLAAYIKPTDKYIFVDRSGVKVAEPTRTELAMALKQGRLAPLDNNMLFDRALESVIASLRKPHNPIDLDS